MTPFPTRHRSNPLAIRCTAALWLVLSVGLLATAASLEPDCRGIGTHQQLGLRACDYRTSYGHDCPTCGMTTAFSLVARSDFIAAASVQPAGTLAAVLLAMSTWLAGWSLVTGRSIGPIITPLWRWRTAAILLAIVAGGWALKLLA
jgi:hypothetical protein